MHAEEPPLARLMRYTAWANALLYDALAAAPGELVATARPGRPAGILGVLGHIQVVGLIWKGHLTGQAHGFTSRQLADPAPLPRLRDRQAELDRWYMDFAGSQSGEQLARAIDFSFVDGGRGRMSAGDMLMHVGNHATYHRGYVADMLYESGIAPPTMDLPVFIRDAHRA